MVFLFLPDFFPIQHCTFRNDIAALVTYAIFSNSSVSLEQLNPTLCAAFGTIYFQDPNHIYYILTIHKFTHLYFFLSIKYHLKSRSIPSFRIAFSA